MSLPIVVTHPSTLLHDGLRQLFAKSRFRPVRIATSLNGDLESYFQSLESCVWLTGIVGCASETNALVRKVVSANPGVKAVILSSSQKPEDIISALQAGARGFLCQDSPGETLVKSLELIAHGEMIVLPFVANRAAASAENKSDNVQQCAAHVAESSKAQPDHGLQSWFALKRAEAEAPSENKTNEVPRLSHREMLILRMLMQGDSNKVIARKMVITESTVKVHMKAILRKLRLRNRTQAAIWARNHVGETAFEPLKVGISPTH